MNAPIVPAGAWEAAGPFVRTRITPDDRRGFQVAAIPTEVEHACAVAALMAAAPELYEALAKAVDGEGEHAAGCKEYAPGYDDSHCCWVHVARAALAKAVTP